MLTEAEFEIERLSEDTRNQISLEAEVQTWKDNHGLVVSDRDAWRARAEKAEADARQARNETVLERESPGSMHWFPGSMHWFCLDGPSLGGTYSSQARVRPGQATSRFPWRSALVAVTRPRGAGLISSDSPERESRADGAHAVDIEDDDEWVVRIYSYGVCRRPYEHESLVEALAAAWLAVLKEVKRG